MSAVRSRDPRFDGLDAAFAACGFGTAAIDAPALARLEPWVFPSVAEVWGHWLGALEDAAVRWIVYTAADDPAAQRLECVAIVSQPGIVGGVVVYPAPRGRRSAPLAKMLFDAITWVPPLTLLKLARVSSRRTRTMYESGDAEFDRRFRVASDSPDTAPRALQPALCAALVREAFDGTLELRDGCALFRLERPLVDARALDAWIRVARALAAHGARRPSHPMR